MNAGHREMNSNQSYVRRSCHALEVATAYQHVFARSSESPFLSFGPSVNPPPVTTEAEAIGKVRLQSCLKPEEEDTG